MAGSLVGGRGISFSQEEHKPLGREKTNLRVEDRPPYGIPCDRCRSILIEFRLVIQLFQLGSGLLQIPRSQIEVTHPADTRD
jgi:hypothetical protein